MVFFLLGYAALTMLLVALLHRFRPRWTRSRLIAIGALSGPTLIVMGSAIALVVLALGAPQTEAGDIDGTYHAMAAYTFLIIVGAPLAALLGLLTAWLATGLMKAWPVA